MHRLLLWIALLAMALVAHVFWGAGAIVVWFVVYAYSFQALHVYAGRIPLPASRRASRRRRFWRVLWLALPVALTVNFVTLSDTFRAYGGDGYEGIGWPVPFLEHGGFAYEVRYSLAALAIDLVFCVGLAWATALALRDGGRRLKTLPGRFFRRP